MLIGYIAKKRWLVEIAIFSKAHILILKLCKRHVYYILYPSANQILVISQSLSNKLNFLVVIKPKHIMCYLIWYQMIVGSIHGTYRANHTYCLGYAPKK
jgi:hypothetical protein